MKVPSQECKNWLEKDFIRSAVWLEVCNERIIISMVLTRSVIAVNLDTTQ